MLNKTKTTTVKPKCINCLEEIKKADRSRKYAHELKNIFMIRIKENILQFQWTKNKKQNNYSTSFNKNNLT